ncbi:MAG: hypothetical protein EOO70_05155 [Myxococcaceae bacterium]|nr:MAG: hypothetical protein EOO70_05155 [Myxococcaceae bacterium]
MGNIPRNLRIPEADVVKVIQKARDEREPIVAKLMSEFGLLEHQAKYHYSKVTKKGLVPNRRDGHAPRVAIMFLNSPNEERIELCQICKTPWPCNMEILRRQSVPRG